MLSKNQISQIVSYFVEYVNDETGILLDEEEIISEVSDSNLIFKIDNVELAQAEYDPEDIYEEDIALNLMESAERIQTKLTRIKINILEKQIQPKYSEIKSYLNKFLSPNKIENLYFEVKDFGYEQKHWMTDDETSQGYPIIGLSITNFEEIDFMQELNIYYPEDALDMTELFENLKTYFDSHGKL